MRALGIGIVLLAASIAGCGGDTTAPDAGLDAGAEVGDGGIDAAPARDAGTDSAIDDAAIDGAIDDAAIAPDSGEVPVDAGDLDAGPDGGGAPLCRSGVETSMPAGLCDGRGIVACSMWAADNAPDGRTAYAVCLRSGTGGCARANSCEDTMVPDTCKCGTGPACAPDQACIGTAAGYECVCIQPL